MRSLESELEYTPETLRIIDICEPRMLTKQNLFDDDDDAKSYQPTITFYDEFKDLQPILKPLLEGSKSSVFRTIWTYNCTAMSLRKCSTNFESDDEEQPSAEIIVNIWNPSIKRFNTLCQSLETGSMTILTADDVFGSFGKNYDMIEAEVNLMCQDLEKSKLRVQQIKSHHESLRYVHGTKVILRAKDMLKLKGDFSALEALQNVVSVILKFF